MPGMKKYDAIIIGGGHNGLTSAAYLSKAGKKVLVLERRYVLGGAAVTEEMLLCGQSHETQCDAGTHAPKIRIGITPIGKHLHAFR